MSNKQTNKEIIRYQIFGKSDGMMVASGQTTVEGIAQVREEIRKSMNDEYVVKIVDSSGGFKTESAENTRMVISGRLQGIYNQIRQYAEMADALRQADSPDMARIEWFEAAIRRDGIRAAELKELLEVLGGVN